MAEYSAPPQLVAIALAFGIAYTLYALRKLARRAIDLYDFLLLITLAVVPGAFILAPGFAMFVGRIAGVALPLSVMFGVLFVAVFILLHRSLGRIHRLETRLVTLTQEMALLAAARSHDSQPGSQ